jgi:hypothetical protein
VAALLYESVTGFYGRGRTLGLLFIPALCGHALRRHTSKKNLKSKTPTSVGGVSQESGRPGSTTLKSARTGCRRSETSGGR